ncbi:MAG TPA: hypothetical protein VL119_12125 [Acidimicrobiia bacterium]|nr:hypothetical protein [Acidimicrobiia bacterium]
MLDPLPVSFGAAREAMHALAEHVFAPLRYRADGHIGLTPTTNGFGTPVLGDGERARVEGVELVYERPGTTTRVGLTTLGAAARFVGVPLGAPEEVYRPATECAQERTIAIDGGAAKALADWIALADSLLTDLRDAYAAQDTTGATIWPEHFDLACEMGDAGAGTRATYGASPGDDDLPEPYLYVGPWDAKRRVGTLAAYPFGAAITYDALRAGRDPRGTGAEFLMECAALVLGQP